MFRAITFRSSGAPDCVTAYGIVHSRCCWLGRDHGCIIPQIVTHSQVPLKMGKIIARKMLSWLELLINRYSCI